MSEGTLPKIPKVYVGVATYRDIAGKTVADLWNTFANIPDVQWSLTIASSANVPFNRNSIVEQFLETDFEYLLFIDQDMRFTYDQVHRLIKTIMETPDAGLITGLYVKRDGSIAPLCGWVEPDDPTQPQSEIKTLRKIVENRGNLVQADFLPTGFMIIRREAFMDMEPPYFKVAFMKEGAEKSSDFWSSDSVFCHFVREAGWQTYCHLGIEVGHIGEMVYHPSQFYQMAPTIEKYAAIAGVKEKAIEEYGVNTREYWNTIWNKETELGVTREYQSVYEAIGTYVDLEPGSSILDLGCGTGQLLEYLAFNYDVNLHGVDISDEALQQTLKRLDPRKPDLQRMDVGKDNLPPVWNKAFDAVFSTEVIEHLDNPQLKKFFKNAWNALKPGGMLVVSCPDNCMPPSEEPEHVRLIDMDNLRTWMRDYLDLKIGKVGQYLIAWGVKPDGT